MTKIAEILEYLKEHKDKHVRLAVLVKAVDSSISTVSAAVHSLRQKGYLIKSEPEGYLFCEKPVSAEPSTPATESSVPAPIPTPTSTPTTVPETSMSSRIVEYMKERKRVCPQEIIDNLSIKKGSVYALISQIKKEHKVISSKGWYTYVCPKEKRGRKPNGHASPSSADLEADFPWITVSEILAVPESERPELFEAMRKECFYRKVALAFVDSNRAILSTMKGARI